MLCVVEPAAVVGRLGAAVVGRLHPEARERGEDRRKAGRGRVQRGELSAARGGRSI